MDKNIEASIDRTYRLIKENVLHSIRIDSFEVVRQVQEYRQFWRSDEINVILLTESHVFSDKQEL